MGIQFQSLENLRKTLNQQRSNSFFDKINMIDYLKAFQFPAFQRLKSEIYNCTCTGIKN